jgi:hypothetical protein
MPGVLTESGKGEDGGACIFARFYANVRVPDYRRGKLQICMCHRYLIERDIAVDEADGAKVARLDTLMREAVNRLAVDALMLEAA